MKSEFPPNINPRLATLLAMFLGYTLIDDFNSLEQIAIGNWLNLIGQVIITNGDYQRVIEDRIEGGSININSRAFKCGGSFYESIKSFSKDINKEDLENLQKAVQRINEELDKIKKEL